MAAILECIDPWGRPVELDDYVWTHKIVRGGTRLPETSLDSVRMTLTEPDFVTFDKVHADGECFYRLNALPGRLAHLYLKICVKIVEDIEDATVLGRVITGYPTDRVPQGERRKWP